jgi:hypothetical protein
MRSVIARIEQRDQYSPGNRMAAGGWYPRTPGRPGKWYVAGNFFAEFPEVTANNWKGMRGPEQLARVNTPFEGWPVNQETARDAYDAVLARAGATLPRRDAVDARVVEIVRTGKPQTEDGVVRDPNEVGGYPEFSFEPADVPADGDHDGMPDEWEATHALDAGDADDGATDADGDGYTNVEEWLNGTNPKESVDYRNLGNNIDAISG